MKKVAILQSNYIPWKGYFDLINYVDEFILYDDIQYTKRDWRNRNKIKTPQGLQWLTIPVNVKGKYYQKIFETKVTNNNWVYKHWNAIRINYSKTPYFDKYREIFQSIYESCNKKEYLSLINYSFIKNINKILKISTKIRFSSEFKLAGNRTEKLINICKQCNGDIYVSGPSAKTYLDHKIAYKENINIEWMDYSGYKEYHQLYPPFEHRVSVLDLIFNEGNNSKKFMNTFDEK